jgi:hypothetical protein
MNAQDYLRRAHELKIRLNQGENRAAAATACGVATGSVAKAIWLAKIFTPTTCAELGAQTLRELSPSHLELVATLPGQSRTQLLRLAARERMTVRQLKFTVAQTSPPARSSAPAVIGGETQFKGVATALGMYADWSDESLDRVLHGPCGALIQEVAERGARLLRRIQSDREAA